MLIFAMFTFISDKYLIGIIARKQNMLVLISQKTAPKIPLIQSNNVVRLNFKHFVDTKQL